MSAEAAASTQRSRSRAGRQGSPRAPAPASAHIFESLRVAAAATGGRTLSVLLCHQI